MLKRRTDYSDDRRIDMTAYMGPRRGGKNLWEGVYGGYPLDPKEGYPSFFTDDVFSLYKEAGLNLLLPEGDAFYGTRVTAEGFVEEPDFTKSDLYTYMKQAEKFGLYVYPSIEEVFSHMAREEGPFEEREKQILKDFVQTLQQHFPNTFRGILLTDEPPYSAMERIKKIMEYLRSEEIKKIKPSIDVFTSMHPIYAPMCLLHKDYGDEKYKRLRYDEHRMKAYSSYMEKTADAIGEISFDHYPFIYENQITPGYYQNLELAAEHGKKVGCDVVVSIQSFQLNEVKNTNTKKASTIWRTPTYEEARWQLYSALAFGVKRIGYYTFWTHYALGEKLIQSNAMVVFDPSEEKGYRKTQLYDVIKEVNHEVLKFDHIFLRFQWQGCRVIKKSRDANIHRVKGGYAEGNLKKVEATRDLLVGCMLNNEDGREGYWIVNAENPFHCQVNDVVLEFQGADGCEYYRKGEKIDTPLEDGVFNIRLGVGEGIFVVPYSN